MASTLTSHLFVETPKCGFRRAVHEFFISSQNGCAGEIVGTLLTFLSAVIVLG